MPIWDHEGCDPAIDAEHDRLYRLMDRLEPVIVDGRQEASVTRAIATLNKRMAEHFRIEEELFGTADWDSRRIMKDDHRRLLNMLRGLAEIPPDDMVGRRRLFTAFLDELHRHDTNVDAPLFRMAH